MTGRRTAANRTAAEHNRDPGRERRQQEREDSPRQQQQLNEYFLKGEGINREVLQVEICRFLGSEAVSRPATNNGVDGYIIRAVRPFTPEMIKDLKARSANFEAERNSRRARGYDKGNSYEDFQNRRGQGSSTEERYASSGSASYPSGGSPYSPEPGHQYQALQQEAYGPSSGYSQYPSYEAQNYGPPSMPPAYPPGYPVSTQGMSAVPAPSRMFSQGEPGFPQPGHNQYGTQPPTREQPYGYPPGNQSFDNRGRDTYYPGPPGNDRPGPEEMHGISSPGTNPYAQPPQFPGRNPPPSYPSQTPPSREYQRQSDYNPNRRR